MILKIYQKKRNFKKSAEPKGKADLSYIQHKKKLFKKIFIVQKHAASHLHYDFRLELNGVLLSWAIPKGPCLDPSIKRLAMHVEDHPLEYATFEGIIPKGQYGGGTVMLWDRGEWYSEDKKPAIAYAKGNMTFSINAEKLNGRWKLIRMHHNDKTWLLIKVKDEYAKPIKDYDVTMKEPNSILSHDSIDEIAANYAKIGNKKKLELVKHNKKLITIKLDLKPTRFPTTISPQLATLVDKPPDGKNWLHEIKLDGYRIITFKHNDDTRLITRSGNDWTEKFKFIASIINELCISNVIFDGEIVVLDDNQHADFQLLQNSIKSNQGQSFVYYIFDLLYYNKYNLMKLPLIKRKNILQKIFKSIDQSNLRYSDHIVGSGKEVLDKSCEMGLEGIVSKEMTSVYLQMRTKNWLKIKCLKRQEFVIGGFTHPQHSRQYFGSLLLGTFNKYHELVYNGKVGTGFTNASLKDIYQLLLKYKNTKMPFVKQPTGTKNAIWVKPVLVAEVEFSEWTKDHVLRHPSFKGLRNDKSAKVVSKESEIPVENIQLTQMNRSLNDTIKLSHPDKILYKEDKIDKQQLAEYYHVVADWILPFIENRPLTLVRCPNGYNRCFYQKHFDKNHPSSLYLITIKEKHKKQKYFYLKDKAGLFALPQLGVLEIHPWGSCIDELEYPDMLIFDLDPATDVPWKKVVSAAFEIKAHLAEFKLRSFVKTTGGKGLHIVVPVKTEYEWAEIKNFAHVFVDFMMMKSPKNYITKMTKSARTGKIYLDYLRNQRGATAVAPYSTRARIHAPVSTPIDWDELTNDIGDTYFTLKTIPERLNHLKKDPWTDFFKLKQSLHLDTLK
jgi:bifunctional non-homologous end joining protein LigD